MFEIEQLLQRQLNTTASWTSGEESNQNPGQDQLAE